MFIILKKITNVLNEKSKAYFINRLQIYDELIEVKSKQLDAINNKIKELENIENRKPIEKNVVNPDIYYDINIPSYKDEDIFNNYKKINNEFKLKNINIIKRFLKEKVEKNNLDLYNSLVGIKQKIRLDNIYEIIILDSKNQMEAIKKILKKDDQFIFEKYSKDDFNILDFINYIDDLIRKEDPTIYVRVGDKNQNYNKLDNLIKTVYDENICKGVLIIYKNKLYDYSLS